MGGRFTFSDDSHGIDQVGANYDKVLDCIKKAGITQLCCLAPAIAGDAVQDERFPDVCWRDVSLDKLEAHSFWAQSKAVSSR